MKLVGICLQADLCGESTKNLHIVLHLGLLRHQLDTLAIRLPCEVLYTYTAVHRQQKEALGGVAHLLIEHVA